MIPEDFDLNSIPPIELDFSKYDRDMQLTSTPEEAEQNTGEYETIEFPYTSEEQDFNDATPGIGPGHDPLTGLFSYEDLTMNW